MNYNPSILAYDRQRGPFTIPLQQAKDEFGELPSKYDLLTPDKKTGVDSSAERDVKKVLNLELGVTIRDILEKDPGRDLKGFVHDFFAGWHRDYAREFGLSTAPLLNLNDETAVRAVLAANESLLGRLAGLDVRVALEQVVRREILNSIPDVWLLEKGIGILEKASASGGDDRKQTILQDLKARRELDKLLGTLGHGNGSISASAGSHADEIAATLGEVAKYIPIAQVTQLRFVKKQGIEFDFAPRSSVYLKLGREFGDCTSDQPRFQADTEIENIFWTVFAWILDRNYQILRVLRDGKPVIKCHILPLFIQHPDSDPTFFLSVDAIETTRLERAEDEAKAAHHEELFAHTGEQILAIADRMGLQAVYSERFSNTNWVRTRLAALPEIFLDTHRIQKIDELEDVYECARALCLQYGVPAPDRVFMELQARNTYLIPDFIIGPNKSFAVLRGDPQDGLSIKKVYGI